MTESERIERATATADAAGDALATAEREALEASEAWGASDTESPEGEALEAAMATADEALEAAREAFRVAGEALDDERADAAATAAETLSPEALERARALDPLPGRQGTRDGNKAARMARARTVFLVENKPGGMDPAHKSGKIAPHVHACYRNGISVADFWTAVRAKLAAEGFTTAQADSKVAACPAFDVERGLVRLVDAEGNPVGVDALKG